LLFYFLARSKILKLFVIVIFALSSLGLVDGSDDWITNTLYILKLLVIVLSAGFVVSIEPVLSFGEGISNTVLIILINFVSKLILIFDGVTHSVDVILESVLGVNSLLDLLVSLSELLCLLNHSLNLLWSESTLIVSN